MIFKSLTELHHSFSLIFISISVLAEDAIQAALKDFHVQTYLDFEYQI